MTPIQQAAFLGLCAVAIWWTFRLAWWAGTRYWSKR